MRVKSDFVLRNIADEYIVIPVGETSDEMRGVITLSESGAFLWELLKEEQTEDMLIAALLEEYAVEETKAAEDVKRFLASITEMGCMAD